ncbi:hypothetical protein XMA121_002067 [Marinobacterium sp. xm-a-121]|uniref:hypothetical protein n=1 Tax=unclassified Marinobacterium TaxID=2644139 RepID=UPI001568F131|nr:MULTISPECIES: hypothetical protein [unclassified Marinobacterium]NRP39432.1 hypothetical protein [Marinobacterium sp. xm-a-121]NRQ00233.1 hypothetical protein [Marinobacterium sp. xm-v-233]
MKENTDAYVEYTLSRLPRDVLKGLTDQQLSAIRIALGAQIESSRHAVDLRIRVPLFFRSYYVVLFMGRDLRRSVFRKERYRLELLPKGLRRGIFVAASTLVLCVLILCLLTLIYLAKSAMGLDIFKNIHLYDLVPIDLFKY